MPDVDSYTIVWRDVTDGSTQTISDISESSSTYTIRNLSPTHTYTINLFAVVNSDSGPVSSVQHTLDTGSYMFLPQSP